MKNNKAVRGHVWIFAFILVFALQGQSIAQSIIRQNIGSIGHSVNTDNITFQQTIGQPFFTASHYDARLGYRPGFIQKHHIEPNLIMPDYEKKIQLYPNPARNFVTIESQDIINEATMRVTDLSGREIFNEQYPEIMQETINTSAWHKGVYSLSISSNGVMLKTIKLVIN